MTYSHASPEQIPADLASRAFMHTSHFPEKRGESARAEYADSFNRWATRMLQREPQDGTRQDLEEFIGQVLIRYRTAYTGWLSAHSRCLSSMIIGPARFPVRRAEKANSAEHKAGEKIESVLTGAERYIQRKFFPLDSGISSDRDDAIELVRQKLAGLEERQKYMKEVNRVHKAFMKNPNSLEKSSLPETAKLEIRNHKATSSWEPHPYPPYALQNNNANIRRYRQRIAELEARAQDETTERESGGVRIVDDVEDNRLRLFFPSKPDEEVRKLLKRNGFKWSPRAGAWQRMRGPNAEQALDRLGLGPKSGGNHGR